MPGRPRARAGGPVVSALAVPVQRADRGQDRPVAVRGSGRRRSRRSASRMKCSGSNQATKRSAPSVLDAAEADEGVHLVQVAADRLRHALEAVDERVGRRSSSSCALAVRQAPDEARRAARSARDRGGRRRAGSGRAAARGSDERRRGVAADGARRATASPSVVQATSSGGTPAATSCADGLAEAVEVGAGGEDDPRSCEQRELLGRPNEARCGDRAGRGPGAVVGGDEEGQRARRALAVRRARSARRSVRVAARRGSAGRRALTPRPGTRSSSSRGARLTSTGNRSRWLQRPGELGVGVEVEHAAVAAVGDLVRRSKP